MTTHAEQIEQGWAESAREAGMSVADYRAYIRWLHQERGGYASWDGPTCSPGYYKTYVMAR